MLKILTAPNSILSQKAKAVPGINKPILDLIEEMKQTLKSAKDPIGVGLASPQVGNPLQIFIARPTLKSPIQVFINPKIIQKTEAIHLTIVSDRMKQLNASPTKKSKDAKLEGCLSLPNIWGEVNRPSMATLSYLDEKGKPHNRKFTGFIATVIQHEMDHLNGILFPKRVLEQKGKLYKSYKNEKGEDVFEEIEI